MKKTCLHLLWSGNVGGVEILCREYAAYTKNNNVFAFIHAGGTIADELANRGVSIAWLDKSKWDIPGMVKGVLELCDLYHVNVVVEHHSAPSILICLMIVKHLRPDIQIVTYAHCNAADMIRDNDKKRRWIYKGIIQWAFCQSDQVIAISESVKASLQKLLSTPEHKIKTIYNGVEISKYHRENSKGQSPLQVIYVGRLIPEKGVETTLRALTLVPYEIPYQFHIVGDGIERERLEAFARKHMSADRVFFWGTRSDIPEMLSRADVFVHMPDWEEGFGITIVEAMASGLLCICSNNGAIPEIISDGANGILIEKGNAVQLAGVLTSVLRNQYPGTERIRAQAAKDAQLFSVEAFARNLDAAINMLGDGDED